VADLTAEIAAITERTTGYSLRQAVQQARVAEAVLQEHPGHPDQKVHGHRGGGSGVSPMHSFAEDWIAKPDDLAEAVLVEHLAGQHDQKRHAGTGGVHNEVHDDLRSPIVHMTPMQGGMHPCWEGRLANGTRVFVKESYTTEHRYELAAESLNVFGMEGVDDPEGGAAAGLVRMPHAEITKADTPDRRGQLAPHSVVVTEWINGKQYAEGRHNPRLRQEEVDDIIVFDFVTANQDRHMGNALVTLTGHVWSIDHGQCFGTVPNPTMLARTVAQGRVPFSPRQRTWLTKVAGSSKEEIADVLNSRVKEVAGAMPFHGGHGLTIKQRAQDLLDWGYVPMETDVGTYEYSGWLPPLTEGVGQRARQGVGYPA
jgi:hypothetical protein